jgi:predicted dehydrogenase
MSSSTPLRLVTLAPGHFHAALVQKEALPEVDPHAYIYSPLDADLVAHIERIARFNSRSERPPAWRLDVRAGNDWLERFRNERSGNVVVIAGRNRQKIDLILEAVSLGYCVLADKPWIVAAEDFPKLEQVLVEAGRRGVFAWDIMTERFEATTRVQRALMNDPDVFGELLAGSADEPALEFESVHYLAKLVAGAPLRRPAWWFDPQIAGEAIADVGTHLADLAMWLAFPEQAIDHRSDIEIVSAGRWPTPVDRDSFREITGLADFPSELANMRRVVRPLPDRSETGLPDGRSFGHGVTGPHAGDLLDGDRLLYCGNGTVLYRLRGRFVRLTTRWGVRAEGPEGDTHLAIARGSRATVTVRHETAYGPGPQVFVEPVVGAQSQQIHAAVGRLCHTWNQHCPGYELINLGDRIHVHVPAAERTGHESHFAAVLTEFVKYFKDRTAFPASETSNLLAKYRLTTEAVRLATHG